MLKDEIAMAPGAVFTIDSTTMSPWSRYNVGYVIDAHFAGDGTSTLEIVPF